MCVHVIQPYGWSALFFAARLEYPEIAKLLIEAGANVKLRDKVIDFSK